MLNHQQNVKNRPVIVIVNSLYNKKKSKCLDLVWMKKTINNKTMGKMNKKIYEEYKKNR